MVAGMVCVQCGAPAAPGRFACRDCGSALVPVAEDGPGGTRPAQVAPDADEVRRRLRRQHVRAIVIAVLSVGFVIVLAFGGAILAWSAYVNQKAQVPGDLASYAHGDGRTYATSDFSVRLPDGYRLGSESAALVRDGFQWKVASATVGSTTLEVASGTFSRPPTESRSREVLGVARQLALVFGGTDTVAQTRKVATPDGEAFEISLSLPTQTEVAALAIFIDRRLIVLAVLSPHHAQGGLDALVASYHAL